MWVLYTTVYVSVKHKEGNSAPCGGTWQLHSSRPGCSKKPVFTHALTPSSAHPRLSMKYSKAEHTFQWNGELWRLIHYCSSEMRLRVAENKSRPNKSISVFIYIYIEQNTCSWGKGSTSSTVTSTRCGLLCDAIWARHEGGIFKNRLQSMSYCFFTPTPCQSPTLGVAGQSLNQHTLHILPPRRAFESLSRHK